MTELESNVTHLTQPVDIRLNVGQAFQADAALLARANHLKRRLNKMIADRIRFGGSDPLGAEDTVRLAIRDCEEARKVLRAATYPRFTDEAWEARVAKFEADQLRDEADLALGDHFAGMPA